MPSRFSFAIGARRAYATESSTPPTAVRVSSPKRFPQFVAMTTPPQPYGSLPGPERAPQDALALPDP